MRTQNVVYEVLTSRKEDVFATSYCQKNAVIKLRIVVKHIPHNGYFLPPCLLPNKKGWRYLENNLPYCLRMLQPKFSQTEAATRYKNLSIKRSSYFFLLTYQKQIVWWRRSLPLQATKKRITFVALLQQNLPKFLLILWKQKRLIINME